MMAIGDGRYTYDDVGRAARGFAAQLTAAGVRRDDKVVFWGENRPEWIACYWGCLIAGIVVVPIDYRSSLEFVAARERSGTGARPPRRRRRAS
jgi:long-chain acyl-CoA synthetase